MTEVGVADSSKAMRASPRVKAARRQQLGGIFAPGSPDRRALPQPAVWPSVRIFLVISPSDSAAVDSLRPHVQRLRDSGHQVTAHLPFESVDACKFALAAVSEGADLVIAAGGDGTIHHVAQGLHASREGGGSAPPFGIVPLGTGNDLAGALGLPTDHGDAIRLALEGHPTPIDVGRLNGGTFVNVSTGGVGAEATEEAPDEVKRLLGRLAYLVTGLKKFVSLAPSRARFIAADGEQLYDGPFLIFAVGNGTRTGGGNLGTPRADMGDGLLDLCIVKEMSRVELFKLLPNLRAGTHLEHPAVVYRKVSTVVVEPEAELSVNADGEPQQGKRYAYDISPHKLRLMLPHGASLTPGPPLPA
ncbi:lipid kinase YegS [soil metagenome]